MSWGRFQANGTEYDLTHLDPFTMYVTPSAQGAPSYRVLVSFGAHTFTRDLQASDPAHMHFPDGNTLRCFCPLRHGRSSALPGMIKAAAAGRAYFTQSNDKFLVLQMTAGANAPYVAFFKLAQAHRTTADVGMFVVSAYEKPNLPQRLPATTLAALVGTVANGGQVIRPKKSSPW